MTKEIDIEKVAADPVGDIPTNMAEIRACLAEHREKMLTYKPGTPEGEEGHALYTKYKRGPSNPETGEVEPVALFGTTVLELLGQQPIEIKVNQVLPIGFHLFERFPFGFSRPYAGTIVKGAIDTAPFGGVANAVFVPPAQPLTDSSTTDRAGDALFCVLGVQKGRAKLDASALRVKTSVDIIVT